MTSKQQPTMTTQQQVTIVGVFEDRVDANHAIDDLYKAGFDDDQIGVAMRHDEDLVYDTTSEGDTHAGAGAVTGVSPA